jgi:anaerobic magnesium-protoporphyrin IX monomethyl ester cyclase
MDKLRKFREYLKEKNASYAFKRAWGYFLFLAKKQALKFWPSSERSISRGKLKVSCDSNGVSISYDGKQLTSGAGLNQGIKTAGRWFNSTGAAWRVIEQRPDRLKISVSYPKIGLSQVWSVTIEGESRISWNVALESRYPRIIEEMRMVFLAKPVYKNWVVDYQQGDFPRLGENWRELFFGRKKASLAGARFSVNDLMLPSFVIRTGNEGGLLPIVQNPPSADRSNIIGFMFAGLKIPGKDAGARDVFKASIELFENEDDLDALIEKTRQDEINAANAKTTARPGKIKKLKILLANLPWTKDNKWGVRAGSRWPHIKDNAEEGFYQPFPFFLAYAASLLERNDHQVFLIDCLAEKINPEKFFERLSRFGPDLLVAETSTPSLNNDLALLKKFASKDMRICLVGPDVNIRNPEFLNQHGYIDYCLAGEYEFILLELVKKLSQDLPLDDLPGLICVKNGQVINNLPGPLGDVDTLPWPDRESLPMHKYLDTPGGIPVPSVQMLASRGCPFGCVFCLWPQVMYSGSTYRARNVIDVVDEMEYLVKKKGFRSVYFDDDTFNIGKDRMILLSRKIQERGMANVPWAIMARPDLMDEHVLSKMREAGLTAVKYGLESGCQELVNACGKRMDLRLAEKNILFTQSLGIQTHLTFTFGLPGETKATVRRTIDFALRINPASLQFSITTPFPGTAYFAQLSRKKQIVGNNWDDYDGNSKSVISLDTLNARQLESARHRAIQVWNNRDKSKKPFLSRSADKIRGYYCQGGLLFTLKRVNRYLANKRSSADSYFGKVLRYCFPGGLLSTLKRAARYLKKRNPAYLIRSIRDNHLEIMGIFDGNRAFKGPHTVQIDLTDHCNNNCLACWCNSPLLSEERRQRPKESIDLKRIKDLISELKGMGLAEIYFSGGGEPFMYPGILEVIGHAKGLGISCSINTNFTLVDKRIIDSLIEMKVDHLTVSVWAGSADVYKALHPNCRENEFYRIRDMLTELNICKNEYPYVKIYNVICNLNYGQIKEMMDFAEQTLSDNVEFTVVDTMPGATESLILSDAQNKDIIRQFEDIKNDPRYSRRAKPGIVNLEHFLRRVANEDGRKAEYDSKFLEGLPCYVGWLFARILPNGDVNSCLKSHRFPVGNIYHDPFKIIWNSNKQMYFRKKTLKARKDDPFFAYIGNDPRCPTGCYKSCDDISRNVAMHNKIRSFGGYEKLIFRIAGKFGMFGKI